MKGRILFAFFTVILVFNLPSISMAQVLKPELMYCGTSARMGSELYLGTGPFNEVSGCVPTADTQALLVSNLGGTITDNGPAWLAYLNAGGVIISSAFNTNEIYNEIFGTNYFDTFPFGPCKNNAMPSLVINPTHQFWLDNPGLSATPAAEAGCGSDNVAISDGEAEVTALGGLVDTAVISFAIRPQGTGVFWLLEADWYVNNNTITDDSKNFMGALISNGAEAPVNELIFEDSFESP